MKEKCVHFVCTGNTFRSRLAKAYCDSLGLDGIKASSSGIRAERNLDGTICWYTQKLIVENNLIDFVEPKWTQTTVDILKNQDIVFFMKKEHLDFCRQNFSYNAMNFELWNIEDITEGKSVLEAIQETENIFNQIKSKVDKINHFLAH